MPPGYAIHPWTWVMILLYLKQAAGGFVTDKQGGVVRALQYLRVP
jgi:hypothetical protein